MTNRRKMFNRSFLENCERSYEFFDSFAKDPDVRNTLVASFLDDELTSEMQPAETD